MAEGRPPSLQLPPMHPPPVVPAMPPAPLEQPLAPPVRQVQNSVQPAQVQV